MLRICRERSKVAFMMAFKTFLRCWRSTRFCTYIRKQCGSHYYDNFPSLRLWRHFDAIPCVNAIKGLTSLFLYFISPSGGNPMKFFDGTLLYLRLHYKLKLELKWHNAPSWIKDSFFNLNLFYRIALGSKKNELQFFNLQT